MNITQPLVGAGLAAVIVAAFAASQYTTSKEAVTKKTDAITTQTMQNLYGDFKLPEASVRAKELDEKSYQAIRDLYALSDEEMERQGYGRAAKIPEPPAAGLEGTQAVTKAEAGEPAGAVKNNSEGKLAKADRLRNDVKTELDKAFKEANFDSYFN